MRLPRKPGVSVQSLVICSILGALLIARVTPSAVPQSLSSRTAAGSLSARPHRACFDRESPDSASPINTFVLRPQALVSAELKPPLDPKLPFSTEGSHYNRPPPAS